MAEAVLAPLGYFGTTPPDTTPPTAPRVTDPPPSPAALPPVAQAAPATPVPGDPTYAG